LPPKTLCHLQGLGLQDDVFVVLCALMYNIKVAERGPLNVNVLISLYGIYYETCVIYDNMGQVVIQVVLYPEAPGMMVSAKECFGLKYTAFVTRSLLEHLYCL
jgi:hypothetical protein